MPCSGGDEWLLGQCKFLENRASQSVRSKFLPGKQAGNHLTNEA